MSSLYPRPQSTTSSSVSSKSVLSFFPKPTVRSPPPYVPPRTNGLTSTLPAVWTPSPNTTSNGAISPRSPVYSPNGVVSPTSQTSSSRPPVPFPLNSPPNRVVSPMSQTSSPRPPLLSPRRSEPVLSNRGTQASYDTGDTRQGELFLPIPLPYEKVPMILPSGKEVEVVEEIKPEVPSDRPVFVIPQIQPRSPPSSPVRDNSTYPLASSVRNASVWQRNQTSPIYYGSSQRIIPVPISA